MTQKEQIEKLEKEVKEANERADKALDLAEALKDIFTKQPSVQVIPMPYPVYPEYPRYPVYKNPYWYTYTTPNTVMSSGTITSSGTTYISEDFSPNEFDAPKITC